MDRDRSIIYVMVVCKGVPVADYSSHAGTFKAYCEKLITKFSTEKGPRITYRVADQEQFLFHVLTSDDLVTMFICVTLNQQESEKNNASTNSDESKVAFMCLGELMAHFEIEFEIELKNYRLAASAPLPYEMKKAFQLFIVKIVNRYNNARDKGVDVKSHQEGSGELSILYTELKKADLAQIKTPLLVQSTHLLSKQRPVLRIHATESWITSRMQKHPYLMIGFCIFIGVLLLLYFVVVVPLCGARFEVKDDNGRTLCWFY